MWLLPAYFKESEVYGLLSQFHDLAKFVPHDFSTYTGQTIPVLIPQKGPEMSDSLPSTLFLSPHVQILPVP